MSKTIGDLPYVQNNYQIIRQRELGFRKCIGDDDDLAKKIYTNLDVYDTPTYKSRRDNLLHAYKGNKGGVFNLEFSPDGKLLAAACEGKSVLLFDASNQRLLKTIDDAHMRCVNCVRFLDSNSFATCSDDGTTKTWDLRFLKSSTRTLQGHSNWVKNIEYSEREKVLVTSGFDGSIYSWDLNNYNEGGIAYNKVFVMMGLMRMKLTPDSSKMIITSTNGFMIIVHDLNLTMMSTDLKNFRPNLYRLMQLSEQTLPSGTFFNPLFASTRNRLEFIDDFPNKAEVISSVQIHPMGWCALSRNVGADEKDEYTCVHDIQMKEPQEYEDMYQYVTPEDPDDENVHDENRITDIWIGFRTCEQNDLRIRPTMNIISSGLLGQQYNQPAPEDRNRIVKNLPRLTHFKKETISGKGYIKELCFSTDGRIVVSPYYKGVRLLAFNRELQELCKCVPQEPQELYTVAEMTDFHSDTVVSCKFNTRHYQMVSGCLAGEIVWYRPIL